MGGPSYLEGLYEREGLRFSRSQNVIRIFDSYRPFYLLRLDLFVYTRIAFTYLFLQLHLDIPILYTAHCYAGFCILPIETSISAAVSAVIFSWFFIRYLRPIIIPLVEAINTFFFGLCVNLVDFLVSLTLMILSSLFKLLMLCLSYLLVNLVDYLLNRLIRLIIYPISPILTMYGLSRLRLLRPLRPLTSHLLAGLMGA
jgi:hypothetical protein